METVEEHEHETAHVIEHTAEGVAQGKGIVEDWLYAEDSSSDDESAEDEESRSDRLAASYVRYEDDEDGIGGQGGIGATVYDHHGGEYYGDEEDGSHWEQDANDSDGEDAWSSDGEDDEDWETPQSSQWGTWLSLTSSSLQDTITKGTFSGGDVGDHDYNQEQQDHEYLGEEMHEEGGAGGVDETGFRMDSDSEDDEGGHGAHHEHSDAEHEEYAEEGADEAAALEYSVDSDQPEAHGGEEEQYEGGEGEQYEGGEEEQYEGGEEEQDEGGEEAQYGEGDDSAAEEGDTQEDVRESGTVSTTPNGGGDEGGEGGAQKRKSKKSKRKMVVHVRKRKPGAAAAFAERLLERHAGMRCVIFQGEAAAASDAVRATLVFLDTHAVEGWAVSGVRASRGSKQQKNLARRQRQAGVRGFEPASDSKGDEGGSEPGTPQSSRSSRGKSRKNRRRLQVQIRVFRYGRVGGVATGEPPQLTPDTLSAQLLGVRLADAMRDALGVHAEELVLSVPPADAAVPRTVEGPFHVASAAAADGVKGGYANIHTLHVRTKRPNETDAEFGVYMRKCVEGVWKVAGRVHAAVTLARQSSVSRAELEGTAIPPYGAVLLTGHGKSIATALSVATQAVGASRDAAAAMQAAATSSGYGGGATAWEAPPGGEEEYDYGAAAPSLKGVKGPSRVTKRRAKAPGARAGWAKGGKGASNAAGTGRPRGKLPPLTLADIAVGWAQPYKAPPPDAPAALGTAFDREGGTMTASKTGLLGAPSALDGTGRVTPATLLVRSGAGTSGSRTRDLAMRSAAENVPSECASVPAVTVTLFVVHSLF